jgi:hypothetical protein
VRVNCAHQARDFQKGQKPRSRDSWVQAVQYGSNHEGNGKWVRPLWKQAGTFWKEKAPKGESHERCRREKKPTGIRREETVKRVTKP